MGLDRARLVDLYQSVELAKIPDSMEGNFNDFHELYLSKEDYNSFKVLHEKSLETGYEHGQVILQNGEVLERCSNMQNRVDMAYSHLNETGLKLYHSHTNDTIPSKEDLKTLLDPKVAVIGNVTRNGDVYRAYVGNGWVPSKEEFDSFVKSIYHEVNLTIREIPEFEGWTLEERNYMIFREQSYRIARNFEWTIEGGKLDDWK